MDNFFAMGFNWRHFVPGFLLIPVFSFGYSSELEALSDIGSIVSEIQSMQTAQKVELRQMIMGQYNRGVVPSLERLEDYLYSLLVQSADQLDTNNWYLSRIENAILNSTQKVEVVSSSLDPLLASVSNVNVTAVNILNAITNAPLAYSPAFLTNYYASTLPFVYPHLNQNSMRKLYQIYFGHLPSSVELSDFTSAYRFTTFLPGLEDYFLDISPDALPPGSIYSTLVSTYRTTLNLLGTLDNKPLENAQKFARDRYYQYGTRPLFELLSTFTNHNILSESPFVQVQTETGTDHGFSNAFKDTVGDLAASIVPTMEDNLPEVNTNDITEVEDGSFSTLWQRESSQSADNNALTGLSTGIDSVLHSASSSISGVFDVGNGSDYVITVPNAFSGSDFVYTIPSMAPRYRPYVLFFVGLLKCCMVIYFALLVWEGVFKEVWMGRRF